MGLLQKAVETYDAHENLAGVYENKKKPLAPISHNITKAEIEITIDRDGNFIKADKIDENASPIIIPVTVESSSRTRGIIAHPLCDKIKYVSNYKRKNPSDNEYYTKYIKQLTEWTESKYTHPSLRPILKYVTQGSILKDLECSNLIKLDDNGVPNNEDSMICWRVNGIGEYSGAVYENKSLFKAFNDYIESQKGNLCLCMISGKESKFAHVHPKGIIPSFGNAKMISSNDTSNFTFRGRFNTSEQAASISYISSQKLHNALKWLLANQRINIEGRYFLCWNPMGNEIQRPDIPFLDENEKETIKPSEYKDQIRRKLLGLKSIIPSEQSAVIAAFDVPDTEKKRNKSGDYNSNNGRLSLTYYSELLISDLLERLAEWDETCCFCGEYGKYKEKYGISAPSLENIIEYAFGTQHGNDKDAEIKCDDKIKRQHFQRLFSCRVDGAKFPYDIMAALVQNASNPLAYNCKNRKTLNFITCAVIRKYKYDNFKEEWEMALEPEKRDLSYQYGRLLAAMEGAENAYYYQYNKGKSETDSQNEDNERETNAIRMQSVFSKRPAYAAKIIIERLKNSYIPRLKPKLKTKYEKLIGEIYEQISTFPDSEHNRALKETYIMGYYLQKNALFPKGEKTKDED
ncbi:MAG: type I-C CRISPR-associated protein Cas8c/Csd1 [Eubacteriales bacterium]|jgi:CRISPR-associated protein Csd1